MRILSTFLLTVISTATFAYGQPTNMSPQGEIKAEQAQGDSGSSMEAPPTNNIAPVPAPENTPSNDTQQQSDTTADNNQEPEYLLNFNTPQDTTADQFTDVPNEPAPGNAIGY